MKKYPGRAAALAALLLAVLFVLSCAGCSRAAVPAGADPAPTQEPSDGDALSQEPPAIEPWQALEFTLNDTALQLPLTLKQLQDLGFELAPYEGETFWEVLPGWQTMFFMTHPDCGPSPVLEGVLSNPDGGDTPMEQWLVQSLTITLMHQLENGEEPLPPQVELAGGIGFGYSMPDVFNAYSRPSWYTGMNPEIDTESENGWKTVRYDQDGRQMSFRFAGDGAYLISLQLALTPESWLDGTAAPTLEQLEALEASGSFEELIPSDAP